MKKILAAALPLAFMASLPAAAAGPAVKAGLWEVVAVAEKGGPNNKSTVTSRVCYGADDVKDLIHFVPVTQEIGWKCNVQDFKNTGDASSWKITCTTKTHQLAGAGTMTLKADSYAASISLEQKPNAAKSTEKPLKIQETVNGKLVGGECK